MKPFLSVKFEYAPNPSRAATESKQASLTTAQGDLSTHLAADRVLRPFTTGPVKDNELIEGDGVVRVVRTAPSEVLGNF